RTRILRSVLLSRAAVRTVSPAAAVRQSGFRSNRSLPRRSFALAGDSVHWAPAAASRIPQRVEEAAGGPGAGLIRRGLPCGGGGRVGVLCAAVVPFWAG